MSMNTSITGTSNSVDRVAPVSKSKEVIKETTPQTSDAISTITRISDLKTAGLRGEHYTVSDEQLVKAIDRAIKSMQGKATNLEFTVHEQTKLIAVKVIDSESGEVIKEIPPEKTLDFVAKLWEMAGILIDEKR